ncbi:MAG: Rieske (2Fe-2S) protein [Candidatus Zixiibacteriota bacterium]
MNRRIRMGHIDELPPGGVLHKRVMARRVAVFNHEGQLFGVEGDCKHMKASLVKGEVKDCVLTCPWHHWKYDLSSGNCLTVDGVGLKKYEVEVVDGDVYVIV